MYRCSAVQIFVNQLESISQQYNNTLIHSTADKGMWNPVKNQQMAMVSRYHVSSFHKLSLLHMAECAGKQDRLLLTPKVILQVDKYVVLDISRQSKQSGNSQFEFSHNLRK